MSDTKISNFIIISFYLLGFKERNIYEYIKFEAILKEPVKIEKETFELIIKLEGEKTLNDFINEHIYIIPLEQGYTTKEYEVTFFCGIDNVYNLVVNEEGDCSLEIISMLDVNYEDNISEIERKIHNISYNGKIIDNFEELLERKRWNIINAKIENFGNDLFSSETLGYMKKNKNKSYKYDILMKKENNIYFLREKGRDKANKVLDDDEKKKLEEQIKLLNTQLTQLFKEMEEKKELGESEKNQKKD